MHAQNQFYLLNKTIGVALYDIIKISSRNFTANELILVIASHINTKYTFTLKP